jgi:hypothetical protein
VDASDPGGFLPTNGGGGSSFVRSGCAGHRRPRPGLENDLAFVRGTRVTQRMVERTTAVSSGPTPTRWCRQRRADLSQPDGGRGPSRDWLGTEVTPFRGGLSRAPSSGTRARHGWCPTLGVGLTSLFTPRRARPVAGARERHPSEASHGFRCGHIPYRIGGCLSQPRERDRVAVGYP